MLPLRQSWCSVFSCSSAMVGKMHRRGLLELSMSANSSAMPRCSTLLAILHASVRQHDSCVAWLHWIMSAHLI